MERWAWLLMALWSLSASAQMALRDPLVSLDRFFLGRGMRSSSSAPDWRNSNADARPIAPGQTLTLADLQGPGRITHLWFTISAEDPYYPRTLTLRIYWDGEEDPSVECPLGDFFAVGHGLDVPVNSAPVQVSSDGRARNCYWPMPFQRSARITLTNDSPKHRVRALYWYVDWVKVPRLPRSVPYFHAQYRQEFPCEVGKNYLILEAKGRGHYVGTVLSVHHNEPGWFGEGDDFFFIDGEKEPSLRGTGTEDYFSDAWGFRLFQQPYHGVTVWEGFDIDDRGTAYRWHIPDPVPFSRSLRVEIEHKGFRLDEKGKALGGFLERADHYSTVAFWYQEEPHHRFTTLPPGPERIVPHLLLEAEALRPEVKAAEPERLQIQEGGAWSGGRQLFYTATLGDGWLEVPFQIAEGGRYVLKGYLTRSWDYGIYQAFLDGQPLGEAMNLYNPTVERSVVKWGVRRLEAGSHTLRFECRGADERSRLRGTEERGYYFGLDGIYLRKLPE